MKSPREYLDEIRQNLAKMQSQGQVTPTENALFGMIDGLAGLQLAALDQLADAKRRIDALERATGSRANA